MENVLTKDLLQGTVLDEFFGKEEFVPKKVKVRLVRREGGWLPPEHEASVMMQDSKRLYCVPTSASMKQMVNPLAGLKSEQLDFLAHKMGLEKGDDFNVHKQKGNFWHNFDVALTRDGDFYDLSDPVGFLKWAVLRSDTEKIAPSWNEREQKGTYEFALVEDGEVESQKISRADKMKKAWMLCGKLESSESDMRDFLWVYWLDNPRDAQKPPKQATAEFLKTQIIDVVENFTDRFLALASDTDYGTKLLIKKGLDVKALALRQGKYYLGDSADPIGNLKELIEAQGGAIHSIDEVAAGDILIEDVITPQD